MTDEQQTSSSSKNHQWEPGALGFPEPTDTGKGYFTTETILTTENPVILGETAIGEAAMHVLIRCRDRKTLDQYIPALKITYEVLPDTNGGSPTASKKGADIGQPIQSEDPQDALDSPISSDLDISLKLIGPSEGKNILRLHIDPPLDINKSHTYRFPHANSAHVRVEAVGGKISATFTDRKQKPSRDIAMGDPEVPFDASEGTPFAFRLSLTGKGGNGNSYQIHGDFSRDDSQDAHQPDNLLINR